MKPPEIALLARLAELGIAHALHRHPPLFTVAESQRLRGALPGGHAKNLFLRDRKERMWLVTVREDRAVDLKALTALLGAASRLSFGSPERLAAHLGVTPGAVTPYGLIHDRAGAVTFVLDAGLLDFDPLNFHPLTNDATLAVARADFLRFMDAIGHPPAVMRLPERPAS
jgi:Ala-tRNA(Pro) deacylase